MTLDEGATQEAPIANSAIAGPLVAQRQSVHRHGGSVIRRFSDTDHELFFPSDDAPSSGDEEADDEEADTGADVEAHADAIKRERDLMHR